MTVPSRKLIDNNGVDVIGDVTTNPGATTVLGRLKALVTGIVLSAGSAIIGKVGIDQTTPGTTNLVQVAGVSNPSLSVSDSLYRPANSTPYAATPQSINMNGTITEVAYTGLVVTVKCTAHGLVTGDRITIAAVDGAGSPVVFANINGNWTVTYIDADHFRFTVSVQPTGSTPQTGLSLTGAIAKCLSLDVGGIVGGGLFSGRLSVTLPGIAMTQAVRAWVYSKQPTVLVDQQAFTLLAANDTYRRDYFDLTPVTEASGSEITFARDITFHTLKCESDETKLYFRLASEGVGTPTSGGKVTLRMTEIQTLG
jgi:hypothetical protein